MEEEVEVLVNGDCWLVMSVSAVDVVEKERTVLGFFLFVCFLEDRTKAAL